MDTFILINGKPLEVKKDYNESIIHFNDRLNFITSSALNLYPPEIDEDGYVDDEQYNEEIEEIYKYAEIHANEITSEVMYDKDTKITLHEYRTNMNVNEYSPYFKNPHLEGSDYSDSVQKYKKYLDTDSDERMKYSPKSTINLNTYNWNQRKLFLSELEFLIEYIPKIDVNIIPKVKGKRRIPIIYYDVMTTNHIEFLDSLLNEMFGNIYVIYLHEAIKDSLSQYKESKRIKVSSQLTTKTASKYLSSYGKNSALFIGNARVNMNKKSGKDLENAIISTMNLQKSIVENIYPYKSMLKFMLPYSSNKYDYLESFEYFDGDLRFLSWSSKSGTETMLITDGDPKKTKKYDVLAYEEQMAYFNNVTRVSYYNHDVLGEGLDHCYDCINEINILKKYVLKRIIYTLEDIDKDDKENINKTISIYSFIISKRITDDPNKTLVYRNFVREFIKDNKRLIINYLIDTNKSKFYSNGEPIMNRVDKSIDNMPPKAVKIIVDNSHKDIKVVHNILMKTFRTLKKDNLDFNKPLSVTHVSTEEENELKQQIKEELAKYVDNMQINITYKQFTKLCKSNTDICLREISEMVKSEKISYPFKKYTIHDREIISKFKKLVKYSYNTSNKSFFVPNVTFKSNMLKYFKFRGINLDKHDDKPLSFVFDKDDYDIDILVDLTSQEEQRVKCIRNDQDMSSYDFWLNNPTKVIQKLLDKKEDITTHNLREALFSIHKECTQFKPTLAFSVYEYFGATSVLDFSAGWGDRLVAAIANKNVKRYRGFDPNTNLTQGHNEILERFVEKKQRKNYSVTYEPFQSKKAEIKDKDGDDEMFDLVFTSPPFVDFERYSDDISQSVVSYPKLNDWLTRFMFASMYKAWYHLNTGGRMILHITDVYKTHVMEQIILFAIMMLPGCRYDGIIASIVEDRSKPTPRPMWVFYKDEEDDKENKDKAEEDMKKYHKTLYEMMLNIDYDDLLRPYEDVILPTLDDYNPRLVIEPVTHIRDEEEITFNVIRDDYLLGGTKQRGAIRMLTKDRFDDIKEIVYAGPTNGFAQVALSLSSSLTGKKATMFIAKQRPMTPQTKLAKLIGGNIVEGDEREKLSSLKSKAEKYVKNKDDVKLFELGFDDNYFKRAMKETIKEAAKGTELEDFDREFNMWLVGGSAVLVNILHNIYPNAFFNVVQVGKKIDELIDDEWSKLYVAKEFFFNNAELMPPYPSVSNYDAKVWQFVSEFGNDGDYIWNVAKDPDMDY